MDWFVRKMSDRLCCSCGAAELPHQSLPHRQGMCEAQKSSKSSRNHSGDSGGLGDSDWENHT